MKSVCPPPAVQQSYKLATGHEVAFSFQSPDLLSTEITPDPGFAERSEVMAFLAGYIDARRQFLETVATVTGLTLQIVDDLGDGHSAISHAIAPATRQ